jgi:uncharacterized membrane protein YccC
MPLSANRAAQAPVASQPAAEHPNAWASFWQSVIRYDASKVSPWLALRNAIGVALPLAAGVAFGQLPAGLVAGTGALNVAFSDSQEPYRQRGRRMLAAGVLVGFAVFAGALCGHRRVIAVVTSTVWAFAAGMMVAFSPAAADLGALSLVVLVVYSAFPMTPEKAAFSGLLAFAGGVLETLLAVALWPLRRYAPERRALGELYRALARAAASPARATEAPPASAESTQAQSALETLDADQSIEAERYRSLLSQAERMRLSLLTLTRWRARIQREDPANPAGEILDRYFVVSSRMLSALGNALVAGTPARAFPEELQELENLAEQLRSRNNADASLISTMLSDARFQMDAMAGQLRSAVDLTAYATPAGLAAFDRRESRRPWSLRLGGSIATLRANLSLNSAAFRHAVRLAVCIAIGDALGRGLEFRRSYWLPMTIAIVLKPDFSATFSRGALRLIGTFAGLLLATAMFHFAPSGNGVQVALIAALMFVLRCYGPANYGILVLAVTALVVLLIALTGDTPRAVIAARGLNTLAGGAIALVAYWLWPTWERTQAPEAMAQLLDAYRQYFRAIRESYLALDKYFAQELDRTRLAARRARSNVEASVDRLSAEPGVSPETVQMLRGMLASSHRLVHAFMALESGLSTSHPVAAREQFRPFADHLELTLYYLTAALRGSPLTRAGLPDLREDHYALVHAGDPRTERYALVNVETDRITNSLNTLREQVLQWIGRSQTPLQR